MKVIVCLGNIGKEYEHTRHNVGFMVADYINSDYRLETKFRSYIFEGRLDDVSYCIIKPTTLMNLSGLAVEKLVSYYHVSFNDILVIQDDLDLDLGTYKLKRNSSSGGHNGIKSIINSLNSDKFLRLKIGIGKSEGDTINYVLGKFSKNEEECLKKNFSLYQEIIECFIKEGVENTLQKYSKR